MTSSTPMDQSSKAYCMQDMNCTNTKRTTQVPSNNLPETMNIIDSNQEGEDIPIKFSKKIHLSNNIVRYLRGPIRVVFDATMHAFDICAQGTHISDTALQAVKQGLNKQTKNNLFKPAFVEMTSDWMFEGENTDRGFNSASIWMRDPQDRRILVKTQGHPLCAVNEWLAYILGSFLDLPINEVQISMYQNNLVTLHTDVSDRNEKIITFMDLPKQTRKILLTDPIMGCMDLFDHIIQNADRNQRNILITMPNTTDMRDDPTAKCKIHLIDHSSSFGLGKLSIISLIACKFHSNHLSVVKFDPIDQAKKFEQYLAKLPVTDRQLIGKTLERFAAIADDQFHSWISEVQDLLSHNQYNRICSVLYQQRDIAKHYVAQWKVGSSMNTNEADRTLVTYF